MKNSGDVQVATSMKRLYRSSESFKRYLMADKRRVANISRLYSANRKFFGKNILEIGCGGAILGFLAEREGRRYTGIDVNPDMISAARRDAKRLHSKNCFVLGDASRRKLKGKFDTVAFIGNGMGHVNARTMAEILRNVSGNVRAGSHFVAEYRDVVGLLAKRKWKRKMIESREGEKFVSITEGYDTKTGDIHKLAVFGKESDFAAKRNLPQSYNSFAPCILSAEKYHSFAAKRNLPQSYCRFTHAIWAPFILETLMECFGWKLVRRKHIPRWNGWLDIYRRNL